MRRDQWTLVGLAGLLALAVVMSVGAQVVVPVRKGPPGTFKSQVVAASKEKDTAVDNVFKALGPAIAEQLRAGRTVEMPGVGTFRVIRIGEHQDLVNGLVATIPARNIVEFVPTGELNNAANAPGAVPQRTIEGYEFRFTDDRVPTFRIPGIRTSRWVDPSRWRSP